MRILLATLALAVTAGAAQAAEIPAKYRGEWCDHGSGSYYEPYRRQCRRGGTGYMRITAKGFKSADVTCDTIISMRERDYAHVFTLTCETREDGPVLSPMWMVLVPGIPGKEGHERARLFLENDDDQR